MNKIKTTVIALILLFLINIGFVRVYAQDILYNMPEETAEHEGTWIQWPHNYLYGPWYLQDVKSTFVSMTDALQSGEKVHIIVYDNAELEEILTTLNDADVPMDNIDFFIHKTDDVWSRDNGPMFVYDLDSNLVILDWGFNGWGLDTPYSNCDVIPQKISDDIGLPIIDLNEMVLEGGAIEHDGNGTMMATRSSITHSSRNPLLSEEDIEEYLTTYMGITNFIWLDGVYGLDITDQHIDGFVKFANDSTIVTMTDADLSYWYCTNVDIETLNSAVDIEGNEYNIINVPLTQNNVITTYGDNLGTKGSYINYYIGNEVVLVPTYNDPHDAIAIGIIQDIYPDRSVIGVDVRNLYAYGGMIHCITQQQPVNFNVTGITSLNNSDPHQLKNSPNPFDEFTVISFTAEKNSTVSIDIRNSLGKHVITLTPKSIEQQIKFQTTNLENGIYFYTLNINGQNVKTNKMIITK